MTKPALLAPLLLSTLLAGCGQPETVTAGKIEDPDAGKIAAAPPVKLPPALLATKTLRCKDNSLVYVDFFNDNQTATLRTKKGGEPTALSAPAAGQPYEGGGYTLTGAATAKTVSIKKPGGTAQSCTA